MSVGISGAMAGTVTEKDRRAGDRTYKAVGLQTLLNTVRDTGALNMRYRRWT